MRFFSVVLLSLCSVVFSAAANANANTNTNTNTNANANANTNANANANTDTNAKAKILFVTGQHSNKAKIALLSGLAKPHGLIIERKPENTLFENQQSTKALFDSYDLIVLEAVSSRETQQIYSKYIPLIANSSSRFLAINGLNFTSMHKGVAAEHRQTLHEYYENGGEKNLQRMVEFLAFRVFANDARQVSPPIIYPQLGIYHPRYSELIFPTLEAYLKWQGKAPTAQQPVIGILMRRALVEAVETQVVDETIGLLEAKGAIVVPFFFELHPDSSDYAAMIQQEGETILDLIINFRTIHWARKRHEEFSRFGVPVMQALTYYDGNQQHWEQNSQGISANMTPFLLALPEAAGVIDPLIVAALNERTHREEAIDYQLRHLVDKAFKLVALKHKANADKKLTVMVWGEKEVGASFLNVEASLSSISRRLQREGYGIEARDDHYFTERVDDILIPFYRSDFDRQRLDELIAKDLAELMPVQTYLDWFTQLPQTVRQPINAYWGEPKDNFMVVEQAGEPHFVFPRIRNGNMLVMRQPPRADDRDEDKRIFHKGDVPMNHYYLAAYFYARQHWGSDAIIHLGTHGSHEYLSGKERGLSIYDQGNLAVGDTPVFYPFIVDDVGEAMQTKRRGRATVLAHMTPPFAAAGLQGEVADMHELMHQYKALDEGGVKLKTRQQIIDDCIRLNLCKDLGWQREKINSDFDAFMEVLHDYLVELSGQHQPLGLHTYGELPEQNLVVSTLLQMLGSEFIEPARHFEDNYYADTHSANNHAADNHETHKHREETHDAEGFAHTLLQKSGTALDQLVGFKTVRDFIVSQGDRNELDKALLPFIEKGTAFYQQLSGIQEMENLLAGLSGQFIPVKNGGDPVRSPEALPTGFNLYGFDPARVPTKAAYEQGKELVEELILSYQKEQGKYPDKLAFSLWSIETMRHYGVLESQALYAMGLRPRWSEDGRVIGTEIIPYAELKRPRIDVVLSATGLYRDAFPNVMQMLAAGIEQIAQLKEESNFVWRNSQAVKSALIAEGVEEKEAAYLSTVRVFSNASGTYGTGVDEAVVASDSWETDSKIADLYLSRMGYFYGADDSRWGEQLEGVNLYAKQLSGTDIALFSRSSNVYGLLSSDDPFDYFGSLAMAVRNLDGASPQMMISNLRDAKNPRAENAAFFLAKELRSRVLHQRWIEEMMKEGYSGATTLSARMTNFWGWQVVDPDLVRDDQWQAFYEVYVEDKFELGMNEWFESVNPQAQAQMLERMLEAVRKEYWQADEKTLSRMMQRYAELVEKYQLQIDNQLLQNFVNQQAAGFGLDVRLPAPQVAPVSAPSRQQVEGQQLQKREPADEKQEWDVMLIIALTACLLAFIAGMWRQTIRKDTRLSV